MISRRGFIKGALALVAVAQLPAPTIRSILVSTSELTRSQMMQVNAIMKAVYLPAIEANIFQESILIQYLNRGHR